jgi:hypothetical protein
MTEFERLRREIRQGNYGSAERLLEEMEIDDRVSAYLRKSAEYHRQLVDWERAWADGNPIPVPKPVRRW